jgi:hypothetical protein
MVSTQKPKVTSKLKEEVTYPSEIFAPAYWAMCHNPEAQSNFNLEEESNMSL